MPPPRITVEHRLGVQAPAHEIWKVIGDLPSWKDWNPLYTSVEGSLGFGAPLKLTVAIPGRKPQVITPIVESWTPEAAFPQVERERVAWLPTGASDPLELKVPELFLPL